MKKKKKKAKAQSLSCRANFGDVSGAGLEGGGRQWSWCAEQLSCYIACTGSCHVKGPAAAHVCLFWWFYLCIYFVFIYYAFIYFQVAGVYQQ